MEAPRAGRKGQNPDQETEEKEEERATKEKLSKRAAQRQPADRPMPRGLTAQTRQSRPAQESRQNDGGRWP